MLENMEMNDIFEQCIKQNVITISRSTWRTTKNKYGVAIDLFCTGVIGHSGHMFLN